MSRVALAFLFAFGAALVALFLGPVSAGVEDVLGALSIADGGPATDVVREVRLPRVILGLLVGGALAVAGVILQALLRNDLAEPYLVGVGPGAFLGVTAAALVAGALPAPVVRALAALLGALAVSVVVFRFAKRAGRDAGPTLLLAGVAIGAFVSAVATAALYVALPKWERVVYWLLGHLTPRPAGDLLLVGGVLLAGFVVSFVRARDLDAVALGEEGAWFVGVHVRRLVLVQGLVACFLAAAAVSLAGLIGFVGLLVPHVARGLVGPGHRVLLPTAMALGGGLLVLADGIARVAHPPLELPVGVVTAAIGAPFLAWILLRTR
jgi:iron complex transport system permease protein